MNDEPIVLSELEQSPDSHLVPIVFRLQMRLRTRQGVVNEVLVKTANADPANLNPLRLDLQVLHDGGTWVSMRQSRMDFELESYDEATRTATYKPYEMRRSDRRNEQILTGWGFSRERPAAPAVGDGRPGADGHE